MVLTLACRRCLGGQGLAPAVLTAPFWKGTIAVIIGRGVKFPYYRKIQQAEEMLVASTSLQAIAFGSLQA